jgi:hypothetical protein
LCYAYDIEQGVVTNCILNSILFNMGCILGD